PGSVIAFSLGSVRVIRWYYILFLYFHVFTVDCNTLRITVTNGVSHFFYVIHAVAMKIAAALGV
ncbi:hypothetical protein MJN87_24565, partial [Salmonella enterica subsp. enterica serovar Anatum]|nr:hypothetical protein [Salmonella enterica subsp. enterica serovar Anatum]MDI5234737.1 hypothetical protein [Salmonella enterica subsp. enterica serovar Anatum]